MGMAGQGRPPDGGLGGCLLPQGACPAGCAPHFLFETSKRKPSRGTSLAPAGQFTFCAAPGGKEKCFGGSVCASADLLPPAGEGWLSLVEVRDGNARPLGKPPARGGRRIHPAPIFAAAGSSARERERQRKEKQRQYDNHPDALRTIRHGTAVTKIAEEHSVPDGQAKSALAPIRRPPLRAEGHCTGARLSGLFFWTVHGPFSFPQDGKENGGCIPLDKPPGGSQTPEAAVRRPISCYPRWSVRPSR